MHLQATVQRIRQTQDSQGQILVPRSRLCRAPVLDVGRLVSNFDFRVRGAPELRREFSDLVVVEPQLRERRERSDRLPNAGRGVLSHKMFC